MDGSILQHGLMRDFVNRLYGFVNQRTFWKMRLVCRMWARQSHHSQKHWLQWMKVHGPQRSVTPTTIAPVLRLTIPLHEQVLTLAMKRQRAKWCTRLHSACNTIRHREMQITYFRKKLLWHTPGSRKWVKYMKAIEVQRISMESFKSQRLHACINLDSLRRGLLWYPPRRTKKGRIQINISNE